VDIFDQRLGGYELFGLGWRRATKATRASVERSVC